MRSSNLKSPTDVKKLVEAITILDVSDVKLMEVCGTHTMAISKAGIKTLLPGDVRLVSGPGCPVCVTPPGTIDAVLELSAEKNVVIATYGDMIRVPGSDLGDSLMRRRAKGAEVLVVYSPMDAIQYAKENPDKQAVFLGVGFETTAPGTAAAIFTAFEENVPNFSVFSMLKTIEPAIRALHSSPGFDIDGFLCPGHVGAIIGEDGFSFIPDELTLPAVIAGFEPVDILASLYMLLKQLRDQDAVLQNEYMRVVSKKGNEAAQRAVRRCFTPCDDYWRGLGMIQNSGLAIRDEYARFDASARFGITFTGGEETFCRCGDMMRGAIGPMDCPLFGKACTPEEPVGPCMVSSEGACAAQYQYN